jgi:hypothetical protein
MINCSKLRGKKYKIYLCPEFLHLQKQGEDSVMMLVGTGEAKKEVGSILIQAVINL